MRKKNIPEGVKHRNSVNSIKNENLTAKIRRNKAEKPYLFKTIFQKILKQTKPSNKISTSHNIGQRNKANQIAKNCWLTRYKRSR